jgi:hypothetical protein
MKDWHYSVNSFYKTANINVDILSRRLYYLERIVEFVCDYFPNIPFPSFLHITDKDDGTVYTWKEWWGGTQGWFHCTIHSPIFNYVYNSGRCNGFCFPVDYDELKERFKDIDKEYWKRVEEFDKEV